MAAAILGNGAIADNKHDFFSTEWGSYFNLELNDKSDKPGVYEVLESLPEKIDIGTKVVHGKQLAEVKSEEGFLSMIIEGFGGGGDPIEFLKGKNAQQTIKTTSGPIPFQVSTVDITEAPIALNKFAEYLGINETGGTANVLIDASSINIMEIISKLTPTPGFTLNINLIVNRESANDPAGKITEFLESTGGAAVVTDVLFDRDPSEIIYSSRVPSDIGRENFFSAFDLKLGPLLMKTSQKRGKTTNEGLNCHVEMTDAGGTRIHYSSDPKTTSSITDCVRRLVDAFKRITSENFRKDSRNKAAAAYTSKRSGDWLQALSINDKNRMYGSLLNGKLVKMEGITFLVTHDIVLLAYALYNGKNVIFTHKTGTIERGNKRKVFIIFINTIENVVAPETVLEKLNAQYTAFAAAHAEYETYVKSYDDTIKAVVVDFDREIQAAYAKFEKKGINDKSAGKICMDWLRTLWKVKGIDYSLLTPVLEKLNKAKTEADANIEMKKEAVSLYTNLFLKRRELPNPAKMKLNPKAFNNDTVYLHMVNLLQTKGANKSRSMEDPGSQVIIIFNELKSHLSKIAHPRGGTFYDVFVEQLGALHGALTKRDTLMTDMMGIIGVDDSVDISEILLSGVQIEAAAGGGGGGGGGGGPPPLDGTEETRIVRGKMSWIASPEELAEIRAEEEEAQKESAALLKSLESEPKTKRNIAKTLTSFGNIFREGAKKLYENILSKKEGGSPSKKQSDNQETRDKFVYTMYLYEIYKGLLNIDSEHNFDSEYYVELAAIALAALETHPKYMDLIYCFYNVLPTKLKDSGLRFLARQVGLHALDICSLEGNLDDVPHKGKINVTEILSRSEQIKKGLGSTYDTQRKALLTKILKHLSPATGRSISRGRLSKNAYKGQVSSDPNNTAHSISKSVSESDPVISQKMSAPPSKKRSISQKHRPQSKSRSASYRKTQRTSRYQQSAQG
jgi:hypothetical protein